MDFTKEVEMLRKELKQPPKIKVLDLTKYIIRQKENPKYKIGILGDCSKNFSGYLKGDIVLYEPYTIEEVWGDMLSKEIERHIQMCNICKPSPWYTEGEGGINTIGNCVGFPLKYIEYEIKT